jgi:hypothetical protein
VLAQVAVEVVEWAKPFGMATVVRVVDGDAMAAAARSICSHYMLSGLHGFDFIIEEGSGATKLIEINPRATQIGHLNLGPGRDLAAALFEALSGRSAAWRPPIQSKDISLFPGEWWRDPQSSYLTSAFHDAPYDDPELALYYGFDLSSGPVAAESAAPSREGGALDMRFQEVVHSVRSVNAGVATLSDSWGAPDANISLSIRRRIPRVRVRISFPQSW